MTDPSLPRLFAQAQTELEAGRLQQAGELYEEILRHDPGQIGARAVLGGICVALRQFEAAELHLTEAVRADPSQADAANNLALLYSRTGRPYLACDVLRDVTARDPGFAEAHFNLGALL